MKSDGGPYEELPVPMFTGWVGTWDRSEPEKKVKKSKKVKKKDREPFGFYQRKVK